MDDKLRQLVNQYQYISGQVQAAQSVASEAARHAYNGFALAALQPEWDRHLEALDTFGSLARDRLAGVFANTYPADALVQVNDMLAKFTRGEEHLHQIISALKADYSHAAASAAASHAAVSAAASHAAASAVAIEAAKSKLSISLSPLYDLYSKLEEFRKSVAAQFAALTPRLDELAPLFSAQAQWTRTVQAPASLEGMHLFAVDLRGLVKQMSDLSAVPGSLPDDLEEGDDDGAQQAIALANERLAQVFSEKTPALTLRKIQELLTAITSGAIRLSPKAMNVVFIILWGVISNFLYDTAKSYVATKESKSPQLEKRVVQIVKGLQRERAPFPPDLRVVVAKGLIVRRGPRRSTPVVGRLFAGDRVWLVKTRTRSWSLVEFDDLDGEVVLRGWVSSRHIKSLRGGRRSLRYQASPRRIPPGAGAFDSGYTDTAERSEELLGELGFGEEDPPK